MHRIFPRRAQLVLFGQMTCVARSVYGIVFAAFVVANKQLAALYGLVHVFSLQMVGVVHSLDGSKVAKTTLVLLFTCVSERVLSEAVVVVGLVLAVLAGVGFFTRMASLVDDDVALAARGEVAKYARERSFAFVDNHKKLLHHMPGLEGSVAHLTLERLTGTLLGGVTVGNVLMKVTLLFELCIALTTLVWPLV